ncbi:hypothetical protein CHUAL_004175 [Chamberlinius hualienensis]
MLSIAALLAILSILSNFDGLSADTCCTFDVVSTCAYSTTTWTSTLSGAFPISTTYPGFLEPPDYLWLQDDSGVLDMNGFYVYSENTLINFMYFYDTPTPGLGSYFHVFFIPTVGTTDPVLLYETTLPVDQWLNASIPCNAEHNYCCGSRYSFPCFGNIEVIASLSVFPPTGLFGFDNLCIINDTSYCCQFISNGVCGYVNDPSNTYNWRWSGDSPPPYTVTPPPSGSYNYFQLDTAIIPVPTDSTYISDIFTIPGRYDFEMEYYVDMAGGTSLGSGLRVYFVEATNNLRTELAFLQLPLHSWTTTVIGCNAGTFDCCRGKGSCSGRLELVGHAEPSEGVVTTAVSYIKEYGQPCPS